MIIHPPLQAHIGQKLQISARIEFENKQPKVPTELWFRFPSHSQSLISTDCDPFVVALLLLAMQRAESIHVRGSLSRSLYQGLHKYQEIFHSWFPNRFKLIGIYPQDLRNDPIPSSPEQACAFSGGVDSFYTFLTLIGRNQVTHKPEIMPKPKLTHTLFMAGFDMPLHLSASISELTNSYAGMMQDLGIHFIEGSTNVRHFVNPTDWTNAHGPALIASALFFKKTWTHFYIPASYTLDTHPQWGSHPELDPLLSTESLRFVHHGAYANRVTKLATVTQAQESFDRLRVCWIQDLGLKNCGQCEKCIRTMSALDILDSLSFYTTFGTKKMCRTKIRNLTHRTYQGRLFAKELMSEAFKRKKYRYLLDLGYSLLRRKVFKLFPRKSVLRVGGAPSATD